MSKRRPKFDLATLAVISREDAALSGKMYFYTGRMCANGHLAPRYVSNMSCVECRNPPPRIHPRGDGGIAFHCTVRTPWQLTIEQYKVLEQHLQAVTDELCKRAPRV